MINHFCLLLTLSLTVLLNLKTRLQKSDCSLMIMDARVPLGPVDMTRYVTDA